jgi:hypothetical protein
VLVKETILDVFQTKAFHGITWSVYRSLAGIFRITRGCETNVTFQRRANLDLFIKPFLANEFPLSFRKRKIL